MERPLACPLPIWDNLAINAMTPIPETPDPNRLIQSLARTCAEKLFEEKWLLAPNLRLGHQWLERLTFEGQPVLNARVTTLFHLAQKIAAPELSSLKKTPIAQLSNLTIIDRVWGSLQESDDPYLAGLHPSWSLFQTVSAAIVSLRMAGVRASDISERSFEGANKGRELRRILTEYESELNRGDRVDHADILRIATEALTADPTLLGAEAILLVPEDLDPLELERRFLDAVPQSQKIDLPVDPPWTGRVEERPDDPRLDFFQSVGEVNEVREVLRRILSGGVRFDRVEILHTNRETYVPLVHEIVEALASDTNRQLPVTFEEGIPVTFSRPGRSLAVWLRWVSEGHPQALLVEMIQEGLIRIEGSKFQSRLLDALRWVRIGFGLDRYLRKIDEAIEASRRRKGSQLPGNEDEEPDEERRKDMELETAARVLTAARESLSSLFELSAVPDPEESPVSILGRARRFLVEFASASGEEDRYAAKALTDKIDQFGAALGDGTDSLHVDLWEWLVDLPQSVRILGSRPRPGHLHVAPLALGGHSGRSQTFILGLDDGRFPGANLQDPILLDSERRKISDRLPTAADRLEKKMEEYWRLLGRLRGEITLSFSSRDIVEDREMFPSPLLVETHRRYTGNRDEDMSGFLATLPPPVAFTPEDPRDGLDECEWWLANLTDPESPKDSSELVEALHPHLAGGRIAQAKRDSDEFSIYDGRLSLEVMASAREPISPFGTDGSVLSATGLEEMGRCPLAYYFRKILRIAPPPDLDRDPSVWLGPLEAGSLLHEVFRRFIAGLIESGESVSFERHASALLEILEKLIGRYRELEPPPDESAFVRQAEEFHLAVRLFLKEEETQAAARQPIEVEMGFGMGTETSQPIEVELSENEAIRLRGRIDRIDRTGDGSYLLWDYKTGGTGKYRKKPPFNQGRVVQPFLYWAAAGQILKNTREVDSNVAAFGYFFPTEKGMTDRIVYQPEQLGQGREIVGHLCRLMDSGAFIHTDKKEDCAYCDYRPVCGDLDRAAENSAAKLANEDNKELDPFRRLRGNDAD